MLPPQNTVSVTLLLQISMDISLLMHEIHTLRPRKQEETLLKVPNKGLRDYHFGHQKKHRLRFFHQTTTPHKPNTWRRQCQVSSLHTQNHIKTSKKRCGSSQVESSSRWSERTRSQGIRLLSAQLLQLTYIKSM